MKIHKRFEIEEDDSAKDVIKALHGYDYADYMDVLEHKTERHWVIGFLVQDNDCHNPLDDDGVGHIYAARRHASSSELANFYEARGIDPYTHQINPKKAHPYAFPLDVYSHSGESWSLSGEHIMSGDRFDMAHGAGVWVPDESCLQYIKSKRLKVDRLKRAEECARSAVAQYNAWLNGDCYGHVILTLEMTESGWQQMENEEDSCWGYVGGSWAKEALQEAVDYHTQYLTKLEAEAQAQPAEMEQA